jgi:hypothetical protein
MPPAGLWRLRYSGANFYLSASPRGGGPTTLAFVGELRLAGFIEGQNLNVLEYEVGVEDSRTCRGPIIDSISRSDRTE